MSRLVARRFGWIILFISIASIAQAATDTWDGGGSDNNISTNNNWADNTAPASDLANTDLIFAGSTRLAPNLSSAFSAHSVTFNITAGAFTLGGQALTVGSGGIVNNDADTQTFANTVILGAAASFNAANGPLTFNGQVTIGSNSLALDGTGAFSFKNIGGLGSVTKNGAGTMTWAPNAIESFDFTIGTGTVNTVADGSTDNIDVNSTVAVNGTSVLNFNENTTLDGTQLTRSSGATVTIAASKTLTIQGGGDANITGSFANNTASTIAVTGTGSTFTTASTLSINGGSTMNITAGGAVSGGLINIGTSGNGTATVDGSNSSLVGGQLVVGSAGNTGSLTFSNSASASINTINVDNGGSAGTSGTLTIQSGATVSAASFTVANSPSANTGTVTITGAGSALTLNGSVGTVAIGASSASTANLNVQSGGTFNSGTGTTTVNATGRVTITNGVFFANGNMILNGQMTGNGTTGGGAFVIAAGKTLTVQNGGDATFTDIQLTNQGATIAVSGAGSTFTTNDLLFVTAGATLNVTSGGAASIQRSTIIGSSTGNGTATVDGSGSSLGSGTLDVGACAACTGSITFRNGSSGAFSTLDFGNGSGSGGTGILNVESGASVTGTRLSVANIAHANTGTVTITGAGSALTLTGAQTVNIGAASLSTAMLNVQSGGTFTSGTADINLNATGTINIDGGTVNLLGSLQLRDGVLNFNSGSLSIIDDFEVGFGLLGADVTFDSTRSFTTSATTIIDAGHTLTLNGGTFNTGTLVVNGTFSFNAGTLGITQNGASINTPIVTNSQSTINVNATNVSLGSAASFSGFSHQGVLNVGVNMVTLNSAGYARLGALTTLAGGTISAPNGVTLPSGSNFLGHGNISAQVTGELGSVIEADGALALGDAATPAGFTFAGQMRTKQFAVTLNSSAQATLGNLTTLGNGSSPGTLNALNGFIVDFGRSVTGFGTISSTNALAQRAIVNGTVQGNSAAQPITLTGWIKGVGSFNNVTFTGTFDPGLSPTITGAGNLALANTNTLIMELGGTSPGSGYDQINATGTLTLGGTLNVSLVNGFAPAAGNSFNILDWGTLAGTFATLNLPALVGGLSWNTTQLYTSGVLGVVPGLAGDYNANGTVDAADYVVWRKFQGTTNPLPNDPIGGTIGTPQYNQWRSHFGQTIGSGSADVANAAVPEPATIALLLFAATCLCFRNTQPGKNSTVNSLRVTRANNPPLNETLSCS